ncbi:MAG: GGDEF domain-containing protein [Arcobacter butzleri]|jgi:diguanylate cyclase (GGDEF)-like protein|nr:GGDEF domain-containing protein [Arcobacteraceae bacterium]MDY0365442.1 GGDEF domain-containing protein [Arcobacteraceae bacterium]NLO18138.1 GGDEF domain-containing protein [Aliarcobacter butzleri]
MNKELLLQTLNTLTQNDKDRVSKLFDLLEWLKNDYKNIDKFFSKISLWLNKEYKLRHIKVDILNKSTDRNTTVFHKGKEFKIGDEYCYFQSIELDEKEELVFAFCTENNEHYKMIEDKIEYIYALLHSLQESIKLSVLYKTLSENSLIDQITGLYNRKFLVEHLQKSLPLALREGKKIAFLTIGIDHFKAVIDEFDYKIGDKVLKALANTLKSNIRESDIVVKLDGEQFLVVLNNVQDEDSAIAVALKLVERFSLVEIDVNFYSNQKLKKTICIGISMYPKDSTSVDQILKNTDISLYEARNLGRGKVLRFSKEQEGKVELF